MDGGNSVGALKELIDKHPDWPPPEYSFTSPFPGVWEATVTMAPLPTNLPQQQQEPQVATGSGPTKQQAKAKAAAALLQQLQVLGIETPAAGTGPFSTHKKHLKEAIAIHTGRDDVFICYTEPQRVGGEDHQPQWSSSLMILEEVGEGRVLFRTKGVSPNKAGASDAAAREALANLDALVHLLLPPLNGDTAATAAAMPGAGPGGPEEFPYHYAVEPHSLGAAAAAAATAGQAAGVAGMGVAETQAAARRIAAADAADRRAWREPAGPSNAALPPYLGAVVREYSGDMGGRPGQARMDGTTAGFGSSAEMGGQLRL